jgi:hypothetical protein
MANSVPFVLLAAAALALLANGPAENEGDKIHQSVT